MDKLLGYWDFLQWRYEDILIALQEHVVISFSAVLFGCLLAVPLGMVLAQNRIQWINGVVFTITNIFQTIPSLALLAMLIPLFGIGTTPAIFALFLYSLLPILRNTFAGFRSVDPGVLEAAKGMGYDSRQRLFRIQLPLALPYMMSGIRLTTVYIISWTTLATLIGAGGLGVLIFSGMGVNNQELILTGAVVAILLALAVDFLLGFVEKRVTYRTNAHVKDSLT